MLIVSAQDAYGIYFFKPEHGDYGWAGADYGVWSKGALRAIDYQTGKVRWEHDLSGGEPSAGVLTTASGITFSGDSATNVLALRTSDGSTLWHSGIGRVANSPMTYELDGRQYMLVASGRCYTRLRCRRNRFDGFDRFGVRQVLVPLARARASSPLARSRSSWFGGSARGVRVRFPYDAHRTLSVLSSAARLEARELKREQEPDESAPVRTRRTSTVEPRTYRTLEPLQLLKYLASPATAAIARQDIRHALSYSGGEK